MVLINTISIQKNTRKGVVPHMGHRVQMKKYFERYVKWITDDSRKYYIYPSIYIHVFWILLNE